MLISICCSKSGLWKKFSAINLLPCYVEALFGIAATGVHQGEAYRFFFPTLLEKKTYARFF